MGVFVYLRVCAERITDDAWSVAYEESRKVLAQWPRPPINARQRIVGGEQITAYTLDCETETGWRVLGDAGTLRVAEPFDFPRRLARTAPAQALLENEDVLLKLVSTDWDQGPHATTLFDNKTQGEPHHTLIVAVGILVENLFPRAAIVSGDIDLETAKDACAQLRRIFGRTFAPPVVLDPGRVRARVRGQLPDEAVRRFLADYAPPTTGSNALAAAILAISENTPAALLKKRVESSFRAETLSPELKLLARVLGSKLEAVARREIDTRLARGELTEAQLLQLFAIGSRQMLCLTDRAWDEIEASGTDELRLLAALPLLEIEEMQVRFLARALAENRALRRYTVRVCAS